MAPLPAAVDSARPPPSPYLSDRPGGLARRAFTLVELLVVIVVLGVLAAVLIPVVGRARASAQSTHCVSNLQQLGRALVLYAHDHNGCLPPPVDPTGHGTPWFVLIHRYTGTDWPGEIGRLAPVFRCPTWETNPENTPALDNIGYALSGVLGGSFSGTRGVPVASIPAPSRTVLLLEMSGPASLVFPHPSTPAGTFAETYTGAFGVQGCDRHNGSANYLFVDGHVSHLTPEKARSFLE